MIQHGGLVALQVAGGWRGALILGASGSGKSDLALRCLDMGFVLVADDRVELWTSGGGLYGAAPNSLSGLIEMRGLGIGRLTTRPFARIHLCVTCAGPVERMPEDQTFIALKTAVPQVRLAPKEASAPAKLRRALIGLGYRN